MKKAIKQIEKQRKVVLKLVSVLDPGQNIKVRTGELESIKLVHCKS